MKEITLLFDLGKAETVEERIVPLLGSSLKSTLPYKTGSEINCEEEDFILTYLSDEQLKEFLPVAIEKCLQIGFLPHPGLVYGMHGFGVANRLETSIENILNAATAQQVDVLMANGIPVFDTVVIGNTLSLMYGSAEPSYAKRLWGKAGNFFMLFKRMELKQYTIEYKGREGQDRDIVNTAALGMVIVQHGKSSLLSRRIIEDSFVNDGMMHSLILAPESVSGLLEFSLKSFFRSRRNSKLPPFAAHIKTDKLKILSSSPIELSVDGLLVSAKEVELEIQPKVIKVVPGFHLDTEAQGSNKEIFKIHSLPKGEKRDELLKGPLPLIHHATAGEFKDLFSALRENARTTSSYLVLMVLSTFIATLGLFSDSSPVIIGAMILAPLMNPIISVSMGVLRQDRQLIRQSLKAIGYGVLAGYICAVLITLVTPLSAENAEIMARVRPNLLDLGVAIGSGVAGAYAHAKKEIAKTLAGVAIAVALVPPLAVSGIGLGWLAWSVFSGALLLLATNFAGMVLAAATTFLFLGFSPFRLAKKGLLIALILVIGVSTPLVYGFLRIVEENRVVQSIHDLDLNGIVLKDVEVRQTNPMRLSVKVITERPLNKEDLANVKKRIEELMGEEVELDITVGIRI
ncbi:DUF389 domain-containing protein [Nafulsella turpanensis]|uniref:DUF389 domain-containing protein n=1 Tax=Nafulsella turpanensis TaxID=1265690 RepID=UPI00034B00A5|nr:DUF389 domain-containing protein [Nafulsella turpanensis]